MVNLPVGTEVILWGRLQENVILLFGEGLYEGDNFVNGQMWPVIKLTDGREITIHQQGIAIGRKEAVAQTCRTFGGAVVHFDVGEYIAGKRPTQDVIASHMPNGAARGLAGPEPEPKTMTDRLMKLKREIDYEESKKTAARSLIEASDKVISAKRAEMVGIKEAVMKELAAIDGLVASPQEVPVVATVVAQVPDVTPMMMPPLSTDAHDSEAKRNALED